METHTFRMIKKKILMNKTMILIWIKMIKWNKKGNNLMETSLIICTIKVRMMKMSKLFHNITKIKMIWHMDSLRIAMMKIGLFKGILRVMMSRRNINMILVKNINSKIIVSIQHFIFTYFLEFGVFNQ